MRFPNRHRARALPDFNPDLRLAATLTFECELGTPPSPPSAAVEGIRVNVNDVVDASRKRGRAVPMLGG